MADYFANETKQQTAMADQSQHHHSLKLLGDTVDDATSKASNLQNNSNNSTNYEENSEKWVYENIWLILKDIFCWKFLNINIRVLEPPKLLLRLHTRRNFWIF